MDRAERTRGEPPSPAASAARGIDPPDFRLRREAPGYERPPPESRPAAALVRGGRFCNTTSPPGTRELQLRSRHVTSDEWVRAEFNEFRFHAAAVRRVLFFDDVESGADARSTGARVPNLEERVAYLEARMTDFAAAIVDIRGVLVEIRGDIRELRERMDRRFEQVDRRFEQVDRRFEQVDHRFAQVEHRFIWVVGIQIAVLLAVIGALLERAYR